MPGKNSDGAGWSSLHLMNKKFAFLELAGKLLLSTAFQNIITFTCERVTSALTGLWIISVRWNISLTKPSPLISPQSLLLDGQMNFTLNITRGIVWKLPVWTGVGRYFLATPRQWLSFIICCTFICQTLRARDIDLCLLAKQRSLWSTCHKTRKSRVLTFHYLGERGRGEKRSLK